MASAAAVATDISKSPLPYLEQDDELGTTGTITSVNDPVPSTLDDGPAADDDDEEDDIQPSTRRRHVSPGANDKSVQDDDDDEAQVNQEMDDELFGDGSEDGQPANARQLDDAELDSGDDEDRNDRAAPEEEDGIAEEEEHIESLTMQDAEFGRHPVPEPDDGELYLLKVPQFLSIAPHAFDLKTFGVPTTDHHSSGEPSSTFSAYNTALTTIRWRVNPSNPSDFSKIQSNARMLRWSDGSLTLQLASDPSTQYIVPGNSLAPPQRNPPKPTPTSLRNDRKTGNRNASTVYNPDQDSFTYMLAPNIQTQLLRITNKFTAGLKVEASLEAADDAVERLEQSLAAAVRGRNPMVNAKNGIGMIQITEDPELAKKKAEMAEKEKLRAQKRREAQEARDRDRTGRTLGRRGPGGHGGGLTVGGLEDDELGMGVGAGRVSGAGNKRGAKPKRQRRGEIYSDEEEEYGQRGRTREDSYEADDGFLVRSDEEEEEELVEDDDEDIDEGIVLEPVKRKTQSSRPARSPSGDADDRQRPDGSPAMRSKRRKVIDDDDEDE